MRSVYGMGVLKESVYWLNFANLNDIIYKGPKQSTTGTADVQLITNIREVSVILNILNLNFGCVATMIQHNQSFINHVLSS